MEAITILKNDWFKIGCAILVFVLLVSGFLAGYIYNNKNYDENPLIFGIKDINSKNRADFTCSCISNEPRRITFVFDKEGIHETYFWGD